jgi:ligand-binding SRPBCC domain-containing protein
VGRVVVRTVIGAAAERCFDLARDVDVHCRTSSFTGERVVPPGRTSGLLELGDTVTFEGRHFGLRWRLTASIVEMQRPFRFVDRAAGRVVRSMHHVHQFVGEGGTTEMIDELEWELVAGPLGKLADRLFVEPHMRWYLTTKQRLLRSLAESGPSASQRLV